MEARDVQVPRLGYWSPSQEHFGVGGALRRECHLTDPMETPQHVASRPSPAQLDLACSHLKCIGSFRLNLGSHLLETSEAAGLAGQPCVGTTGCCVSHTTCSPGLST